MRTSPDLSHLAPDQRADIAQLIREFPDVLSTKLGLTHLIKYEIKVTDPAVIKLHPYKLSPPKMDAMREQINKLLEQKVIEPSTSAYSSPCFLIPKGDNKHRLVIDYRQLNKKVTPESVPVSYTHLDVYKRQKHVKVVFMFGVVWIVHMFVGTCVMHDVMCDAHV